jgi:dihydrofolate reductase/thymidylate synthase
MKFNIVVSVNNHNIIGENDSLLIHSKKDMKNFQKITTDKYPEGDQNILIMGHNTWLSIPESRRPLKGRMNIVLTRRHTVDEGDNSKSFPTLSGALKWVSENQRGKVFVIGGTQIFNECCKPEFIDNLDLLYVTHFDDNYHPRDTTHSFPSALFQNMECIIESCKTHEICKRPHLETQPAGFLGDYLKEQTSNSITFTFKTYQKKIFMNTGETQYLNLLKKVMKEGVETESRNSKVYSLFGERMIFDLQQGFPLLTTKQMAQKTILRELLWFIKGSTSNKELNDKKVHIWDQNSTREFLDSRNLAYEEGDLGPVYGFQWRHFGAGYESHETDYTGLGIDQLQNVIDLIKNEPTSRRIILNSWNAADIDKMALPPCHVMCQFNVNVSHNTLNCQLYQRSGDMFLGVPFNIASYAYLTHIIAKITGYNVGNLIHILGDAHIYESHLDSAKEQLLRIPHQFGELMINDELHDIDTIDEEYFTLKNYNHYPKITIPMIA